MSAPVFKLDVIRNPVRVLQGCSRPQWRHSDIPKYQPGHPQIFGGQVADREEDAQACGIDKIAVKDPDRLWCK